MIITCRAACRQVLPDIEAHCFSYLPEVEDARMYVLFAGGAALVVDPCESLEAEALLQAHAPERVEVLLTHEHYDHISGVNALRAAFPARVVCSERCGALIQDPRRNLSQYVKAQYCMLPPAIREEAAGLVQPFSCEADEVFSGERTLAFGAHTLRLKEIPGHSRGSICILLDDRILFSGDTLVPHTAAVTRLPGGSMEAYQSCALPYLRALKPDTWVYPGHYDGASLETLLAEVV